MTLVGLNIIERSNSMNTVNSINILSPIDGDMLNERDGRITAEGLLSVRVVVDAPQGSEININGTRALYEDGLYSAEVHLKEYKNGITVTENSSDASSGNGHNYRYSETITVYWLKHYAGKYRLSLDDNIWFLQDITNHSHEYKSIFDTPYLSFLRQVHNTYGTKIHINIYYQTDDGFNLTQMPAKYKDEWKANADWLRLSFHAFADKPDKPYIDADYNKMKRDCELVLNEIRRFAGDELIGPVTTLHWGEATEDGCRALRDAGYKGLVADFNVDNELATEAPVSYYLDVEKRRNIYKRFIWKDNKQDIIFIRSAIITDCHKVDEIAPFLDNIYSDSHQSSYIDLLIHEQYFYPHYFGYQPDYKDKVITAVKWAVEKGYKSAFLEECIFDL